VFEGHSSGSGRESALPYGVVITDDLTGACDAGVVFAKAGLRTRLALRPPLPNDAEVCVLNTNSRRLPPDEAFRLVTAVASGVPLGRARVVFKKIDSTLRGNIVAECEAVRRAAGLDMTVVAPSLPSQGRVLRQGHLHAGDFTASTTLNAVELLRSQGADVEHVPPKDLAARIDTSQSVVFLLCDAESEDDIAIIARSIHDSRKRILWAGSSGLAAHAAAQLAVGILAAPHAAESLVHDKKSSILLLIGSTHAVTAHQVQVLRRTYSCDTRDLEKEGRLPPEGIHLIVSMDMRSHPAESLRHFLEALPSHRFGGIFITGGDTASLFCDIAGAQQLLLTGEVQRGVVHGIIRGGLFDGLPMAMKSGGFGTEDCLVQVVDRLAGHAHYESEPAS
jgi:uncharacterized protein YgbK (DUF1537 family)